MTDTTRNIVNYNDIHPIWSRLNDTSLYYGRTPDNADELLTGVFSDLSNLLWKLCLASVPVEELDNYIGRNVDIIGGPSSGKTMIIEEIYVESGRVGLIDPTGEVVNPVADLNQVIPI